MIKVSVIIPVYNAESFLDRSVRSALDQAQTGEVLLIDDRSIDKSLEICKKWEKKDGRVKVFQNGGIKGAGAARNIGLKNAVCDFIAFLDADDYYLPGRFDETENIFNTYPNIDGVSESISVIEDNKLNSRLIGYKYNHTKLILNIFLIKSPTYITGLVIKKIALENIGYFNEMLKQTEDSDYMIRTLFKSCIMSGILTKPVCTYVIHNTNTTTINLERTIYRRIFYKKYVFFSLSKLVDFHNFIHFLKRYLIYDFLVIFGNQYQHNKILKALCVPIHIIRLLK